MDHIYMTIFLGQLNYKVGKNEEIFGGAKDFS